MKNFGLDYKQLIETSCLIGSDLVTTALIDEKNEDNYLYCKSVMDLNITKLIKETGKLIKICIYPDSHDFPGHEFLIILPRCKTIFSTW